MPSRRVLEYLARSAKDFPTEYLDQARGKVVVCGSGHTLWDDLEKCGFVANKWKQNFDIIATNRAVMDIPAPINHVYSNHMDMTMWWVNGRDVAYQQKDKPYPDTIMHSNRDYTRTVVWPVPGSGTSGLNAVIMAALMGYEEIKVCGMPLDNGPHYYDASWFKWNHFEGQSYDGNPLNNGLLRPWHKFLDKFSDVVEPMSGNPRKMWESIVG